MKSLRHIFNYIIDWESWHWIVKYIPILPVWWAYVIRHGSPWFFTSSNPTLTFGGFFGEGKKEMYNQLPQGMYPRSVFVSSKISLTEVRRMMKEEGLTYPVAVKPDAGMMGLMFRKIEDPTQLIRYHGAMTADYIIQAWCSLPMEVSVFYYRLPHEQKGTITGFLKKEFLQIKGDGKRTLLELMQEYPRVTFRLEEMKQKHRARLQHVIPTGETFVLSHALNLSRGGKLVSLSHEKDEQLLKVFDDLSHHTGNFYYGRYDIKCNSIEELKRGNFCILEFNGAGAEPHHIYGDGNSLFNACRILVHHWNMLQRISAINRERGIEPWSFAKGWDFVRRAYRHIVRLRELDLRFDAQGAGVGKEEKPVKVHPSRASFRKSLTGRAGIAFPGFNYQRQERGTA